MTVRAQEESSVPERMDWMGALPDSLPLCKLSLPGTHDSGARYGGPALQTQDADLPAQLRQGIRAFDIRLQEKDGKLGVFHSTAFQQMHWETDVLPAFLRFLREHPTEVLVVSLKREGGQAEAFARLLAASLEKASNRAAFVEDFRPGLTLGDCRGKILFLHRDLCTDRYPGAACSGWADDATCVLTLLDKDGQEGFALLQDEYQYGSDREAVRKIEACIRNLSRPVHGDGAFRLSAPRGCRKALLWLLPVGSIRCWPIGWSRRGEPAAALYSLTLWDSCPVRGWCRF